MNTQKFTEFDLPRNAYAAFDAISMKQLITNRIKNSGIFPDIDYEGSNINGLVDVVAYTYHVLMFYLNQTASDSLFSQADLFENMNKIVSLIGYKTNGNYTSTVNVDVTADSKLQNGKSYTIKRFSNMSIGNTPFSFNSDISFEKLTTKEEAIGSIGANNLLYQGIFKEYPLYTAIGENYEQFTLNIDYPITTTATKMVDHNNIFVFVYDNNTQKWSEWKEIGSLYLADNISKVFEKRLNEYGHQEIKFGDNVNGKRLNAGNSVAIYYLESDGNAGLIGNNATKSGKMVSFNTGLYNEIYTDIMDDNSNYISADDILTLKFDNAYASVPPTFMQTVDDIRKNAPLMYATQNRAVTINDYEAFITKNFSNVIQDVKVCSNKQYTSEYLAYFYNIGLERPNLDDKVLFNQVSFNDSCDFNNVYAFCVPKLTSIINETTPIELFFSQKQAIVDKMSQYKMINHNMVINDPIYLGFDVGLPILGETISSSIRNETTIRITRSADQIISKEQIKSSVFSYIKNFFLQSNNNLGQMLNLTQLSFDILNLNGVGNIETVRYSNNIEYKTPKLSFIYWNPLYPNSSTTSISQNLTLSFFEFPFFYEISNLINKIEVI